VADAGVSLVSVGILLSANRFIRLILNGPMGWVYDRYPRRYLFITALFIGAFSTALYALVGGFWPLLTARLLWGLAWAGIWVGGNAIILDISHEHNRGRWVGFYQTAFFLGASSGAIVGGTLTDWLGFHRAMGTGAALTLLGAVIALLFLPETRNLRSPREIPNPHSPQPVIHGEPSQRAELFSTFAFLGASRLVSAGILLPTLGLLLLEQVGDSVQLAHLSIGVTTLTGVALGVNNFIAMLAAPIIGRLSDRAGNRWQVVAGVLIPGLIGFGLLAFASPWFLLLDMPLIALSGGGQGLATALVGDLSDERVRGRRLGFLFTTGDLTSAIGPPLAYGLMPWLGLKGIYLLSAVMIALILLLAWQ
jgi:MFS family permease